MFRQAPRRACAFSVPTPISIRGSSFSTDLELLLHKVATERAYLLPQWGTTSALATFGYNVREGEIGTDVILSNGAAIKMFNAAQCTASSATAHRNKSAYLNEPVNPAGRQYEPHIKSFLGSLRDTNPVEYPSNHWIHPCDLRKLGWVLREGAVPVAMPQDDPSQSKKEYYHATQIATPFDYGVYFNPRVRMFNVHTGLKFGYSVTALQHLVDCVVPHFVASGHKAMILNPHYYVSDETLQKTLNGQPQKNAEPLCLASQHLTYIDYYWHASQTDVADKVVAMGEAARERLKKKK